MNKRADDQLTTVRFHARRNIRLFTLRVLTEKYIEGQKERQGITCKRKDVELEIFMGENMKVNSRKTEYIHVCERSTGQLKA